MMITILFLFYLLIGILAFLYINLPYYRERAKMTPEERKAVDEELKRDLQTW